MESFQKGKAGTLDKQVPRVVVITGGSSGIGRCTASLFARQGWSVGLIARGGEGLAASCADIEASGAAAAAVRADVTNSIALGDAATAIVALLGPIDVWINCAGNGVYGRFGDVPVAEFQRVTDVTYHGTVNGTRVALAHMRQRGHGSIVNVCSAAAFHGLPLMSSYAGAKAAVRAFGQAIRGELKIERSPIRVTTVYPPAVNTPFFSRAVSHMGWPARPLWPVYQPEVVAQGIWQAVVSGRPEMPISGTAALFSLASRITPALIGWCMGRLGFERQSNRDQSARELHDPTLFEASERVFGVHGSFGKWAKGWSSHLWLVRAITMTAQPFYFLRRRRPKLPEIASPPTHAPPEKDPGLGGLAAQPADS